MSSLQIDSHCSKNISRFSRYILGGLFLAILFHAALDFQGYVYPWNTFLFDPNDRFNDWFNSVKQADSTNPYFFQSHAIATYFPFAYIIFKVGDSGSWFISSVIYLTISISIILTVMLTYFAITAKIFNLKIKYFFLLFFSISFSYPVMFAIDRGNIDLWIAMLCSIFVLLLDSKRFFILGVICLSLAVSLKAYPLAFLSLLLAKKQFKSILMCLFFVSLFTFIPMLFVWDGFGHVVFGLTENLHKYYEIYVIGSGSLFASSDPYNAIRLLFCNFFDVDLIFFSRKFINFYMAFSLLFACLLGIYISFVCGETWRRVLAVSLLILLFPNVTSDYKLCILVPGLLLFLLEKIDTFTKQSIFFLISFLMIPKSYFFIDGKSISMLVNPMLLLLLALIIILDKESWSKFRSGAIFFDCKGNKL